MKISSGLSEIYTGRMNAGIKAEKIYVWPEYKSGKVRKTDRIQRDDRPEILYIKPSPEERDRILNKSMLNIDTHYTSGGGIMTRNPMVRPGSLFNALA